MKSQNFACKTVSIKIGRRYIHGQMLEKAGACFIAGVWCSHSRKSQLRIQYQPLSRLGGEESALLTPRSLPLVKPPATLIPPQQAAIVVRLRKLAALPLEDMPSAP